MGLVIVNILSYSIIMVIELLSEKRKIEKSKRIGRINRGDSIGSLVLVLIGAGISAYVCNNTEYTAVMRGIVITSFAFIYLIYWVTILIIDTKINQNNK